jgi:regulator of replication initiation timing
MDAKELTKKYHEQRYQIDELKKEVEFLLNENKRLSMLVDDLRVDVKMLEQSRR